MKQVFQNPKSGKTRIEEITPPILRSGGVLVRNRFSVISPGTERNIIALSKKNLIQKAKERPDYVRKFFMLIKTKGFRWAWNVAQTKLSRDIALGYSSAGDVVASGRDAEEFRAGDRVACAGQDYASHAEFVAVPKNLCVKIPHGVRYEDAAFATIGAIALQGIRRAELTPGESVAVVGLGLLGQLAVRILRAYGHPVIGFDINPEQVSFVKKNKDVAAGVIGKDNSESESMVQKFTNGYGADAVLIYASAKTDAPLKFAVSISRKQGRIVQIGNILTNIPWRDFYPKELKYISSNSYGPGRYDEEYEAGGHDYPYGYVRWTERRNIEEFLRLLSEKRVSVSDLVTETFPIEKAEAAYDLVMRPHGLVHGVLISYPDGGEPKNTISFINPKTAAASGKQTGEIGIGLIGLGSFMKSEILPHLKKVCGVSVRGIAHSRGLEAKETAAEWKAEYITSDYQNLFSDKNIDVIICATRHSSHARIAKEALLAGKHVYVEKPIALNEEELREVIEAAEKSGKMLFTGFNRRFSRHFIEAKKEFQNSQTPLQILYRVNYPLTNHWLLNPKEGGVVVGEACHFADAFQFLSGSRPARVSGNAVPVGGAVPHEQNFTFTIEHENGSLGTLVYSGLGNFRLPKEYIEIYGGGTVMVIDNFQRANILSSNGTRRINLSRQHKGYLEELVALRDAIRSGGQPPIPLEELYLSHRAIFKVAEAIKTGRVVEL